MVRMIYLASCAVFMLGAVGGDRSADESAECADPNVMLQLNKHRVATNTSLGEFLGERVTSMTISRTQLLAAENGSTYFSDRVTVGSSSVTSETTSLSTTLTAAYQGVSTSLSAEVNAAWNRAWSQSTNSEHTQIFNHQCPANVSCYIYQSSITVVTDLGRSWSIKGGIETGSTPKELFSQVISGLHQGGTSMQGVTVRMYQPLEQQGDFGNCARDMTRNVCDLMTVHYGCSTVDDYNCGTWPWMPFKWGDGEAYFGGWELPEGLCVTGYRNWGRCDTSVVAPMVCALSGSRMHTVFGYSYVDHNDRVCSWRFQLAPGYYCPGL